MRLPWQRHTCRSKYGYFCSSLQVTYLHTKNEGGLKIFISNFAPLSWRIALNWSNWGRFCTEWECNLRGAKDTHYINLFLSKSGSFMCAVFFCYLDLKSHVLIFLPTHSESSTMTLISTYIGTTVNRDLLLFPYNSKYNQNNITRLSPNFVFLTLT